MLDNLIEDRASTTLVDESFLRRFFALICKCGFDRLPLKVRMVNFDFYFAGFDDKHIFLTEANTCRVAQFQFVDLEPLRLRDVESLNLLVNAWLDSERPLYGKLQEPLLQKARLTVQLFSTESGNTRDGELNDQSAFLGGTSTQWVAAVETREGQNAVYRYGISRLVSALYTSSGLRVVLQPGIDL